MVSRQRPDDSCFVKMKPGGRYLQGYSHMLPLPGLADSRPSQFDTEQALEQTQSPDEAQRKRP